MWCTWLLFFWRCTAPTQKLRWAPHLGPGLLISVSRKSAVFTSVKKAVKKTGLRVSTQSGVGGWLQAGVSRPSTLYTVECTLYTVHSTVYSAQCTLYTVHCTLYIVHCTLYTAHSFKHKYTCICIEYSIKSTLQCVNCTLYSISCSLHYLLYSV